MLKGRKCMFKKINELTNKVGKVINTHKMIARVSVAMNIGLILCVLFNVWGCLGAMAINGIWAWGCFKADKDDLDAYTPTICTTIPIVALIITTLISLI